MFENVKEIIQYGAVFAGLYFQVFLLVSYFLWDGKTEFGETDDASQDLYEPTVAVMIPCWNEEKTVAKTVESLLALEYPHEKLSIVVIDDGSQDGTWNVMQQFAGNPAVVLLQKKNEGSKYAALNFGLDYLRKEMPHVGIIGCLDADSTVDSRALRASLREFTKPGVMAVVPSMVIYQPQSIFQWMQKVEYEMATYAKQAFSRINALYIAPGPFSLFRREVFDTLGNYNEAHHVEDMELALRMQIHGMRLSHAVGSLVYTRGPRTWGALLKQRVRWTYGFVMNVWDYRWIFFKKDLGHVGVTIPILFILFFVVIAMIPLMIIGLIAPIIHLIERFSVTRDIFGTVHLNWFYLDTSAYSILAIITIGLLILTLLMGRKRLLGQKFWSADLLTLIIYPFFSAWWTGQTAINVVRKKKKSWR